MALASVKKLEAKMESLVSKVSSLTDKLGEMKGQMSNFKKENPDREGGREALYRATTLVTR